MARLLLTLGLLELTVGVLGFVWFGQSLVLLQIVLVEDVANNHVVNAMDLVVMVVYTAISALLVGTGVFGVALGLTRLPKRLGVTFTGRVLFALSAGGVIVAGLGLIGGGLVGYYRLPILVDAPFQETFMHTSGLASELLSRGLSVMLLTPLLGFAGVLIGTGDPIRGSRREVSYLPIGVSLLAGIGFISLFVMCHFDCVAIKALIDVGDPATEDLAWYVADISLQVAGAGGCLIAMGAAMLFTIFALPTAETQSRTERALQHSYR